MGVWCRDSPCRTRWRRSTSPTWVRLATSPASLLVPDVPDVSPAATRRVPPFDPESSRRDPPELADRSVLGRAFGVELIQRPTALDVDHPEHRVLVSFHPPTSCLVVPARFPLEIRGRASPTCGNVVRTNPAIGGAKRAVDRSVPGAGDATSGSRVVQRSRPRPGARRRTCRSRLGDPGGLLRCRGEDEATHPHHRPAPLLLGGPWRGRDPDRRSEGRARRHGADPPPPMALGRRPAPRGDVPSLDPSPRAVLLASRGPAGGLGPVHGPDRPGLILDVRWIAST